MHLTEIGNENTEWIQLSHNPVMGYLKHGNESHKIRRIS
jgi:hypothetical protein